MDPEELVHDDGRARCPNECGWWAPSGMEYLAHEHEYEDE